MSLHETDIPNLREVDAGVWASGQPSAAQLEAAREDGLESVVSLCPPGEAGWDERAEVEALGMTFTSIPVAAACDVNADAARLLHEALETARKPVLVHCGSGNRVGALFAMKAHSVEGRSKDAAIDQGRKAGLTSLEAAVRQALEA